MRLSRISLTSRLGVLTSYIYLRITSHIRLLHHNVHVLRYPVRKFTMNYNLKDEKRDARCEMRNARCASWKSHPHSHHQQKAAKGLSARLSNLKRSCSIFFPINNEVLESCSTIWIYLDLSGSYFGMTLEWNYLMHEGLVHRDGRGPDSHSMHSPSVIFQMSGPVFYCVSSHASPTS